MRTGEPARNETGDGLKRHMVDQMKWLDRRFEGDIPIGLFPVILGRLRGTPARLEEIVRGLPAEILTKRVGKGWSVQEHAGHLLDLSELDEARLRDFLAGREVLTAADMENRKTFEAHHNERGIDGLLKEFRASRLGFVLKLDRLEGKDVARTAIHPRLRKTMSVADWCHFIAEHDDHHVARITGLVAAVPDASREPSESR